MIHHALQALSGRGGVRNFGRPLVNTHCRMVRIGLARFLPRWRGGATFGQSDVNRPS
jgi:hypothetical protein